MSAVEILSVLQFERALFDCVKIMPGQLLVSKTNLHVRGQ